MSNDADIPALYARLHEVLGPEPAATLVSKLERIDQLATKADLEGALRRYPTKADLERELQRYATKDELRREMAELRTELRTDFRELHTELRLFVRSFIRVQAASMVGLTAIFVAVTRLL